MGAIRSFILFILTIILGPLVYIFQFRILKMIKVMIILAIVGLVNFVPVLGQIAYAVFYIIFLMKIYHDVKYYGRY